MSRRERAAVSLSGMCSRSSLRAVAVSLVVVAVILATACGGVRGRSLRVKVSSSGSSEPYFLLAKDGLEVVDARLNAEAFEQCCTPAAAIYSDPAGRTIRLVAQEISDPPGTNVRREWSARAVSDVQLAGTIKWDDSVEIAVDVFASNQSVLSEDVVGDLARSVDARSAAPVVDGFALPSAAGYNESFSQQKGPAVRHGRNGFVSYADPAGRTISVGFSDLVPGITNIIQAETSTDATEFRTVDTRQIALNPATDVTTGTAEWLQNGYLISVQANEDANGLVALVGAVNAASPSEWEALRSTLRDQIASDPVVASSQVGTLTLDVHQQAAGDRTGICIHGSQGTACELASGLAPTWASVNLAGQWWIVGVSDVPITVNAGDATVNTSSPGTTTSFAFAAAVPASESRVNLEISSPADLLGGVGAGDAVVDNETVVRPAS